MPGGRPREKTPFRGTGSMFAQPLVSCAARPDELAEISHHVANIDSYDTDEE